MSLSFGRHGEPDSHTVERRLPIQATKRALYAQHGFRLIELVDADIERLDDVLPRVLLRFGIESA